MINIVDRITCGDLTLLWCTAPTGYAVSFQINGILIEDSGISGSDLDAFRDQLQSLLDLGATGITVERGGQSADITAEHMQDIINWIGE